MPRGVTPGRNLRGRGAGDARLAEQTPPSAARCDERATLGGTQRRDESDARARKSKARNRAGVRQCLPARLTGKIQTARWVPEVINPGSWFLAATIPPPAEKKRRPTCQISRVLLDARPPRPSPPRPPARAAQLLAPHTRQPGRSSPARSAPTRLLPPEDGSAKLSRPVALFDWRPSTHPPPRVIMSAPLAQRASAAALGRALASKGTSWRVIPRIETGYRGRARLDPRPRVRRRPAGLAGPPRRDRDAKHLAFSRFPPREPSRSHRVTEPRDPRTTASRSPSRRRHAARRARRARAEFRRDPADRPSPPRPRSNDRPSRPITTSRARCLSPLATQRKHVLRKKRPT